MRSLKQDDGTFHTMKAGVGLPEKMIEDMVKSGYFDSTFERNIPVDRQSDVEVLRADLRNHYKSLFVRKTDAEVSLEVERKHVNPRIGEFSPLNVWVRTLLRRASYIISALVHSQPLILLMRILNFSD